MVKAKSEQARFNQIVKKIDAEARRVVRRLYVTTASGMKIAAYDAPKVTNRVQVTKRWAAAYWAQDYCRRLRELQGTDSAEAAYLGFELGKLVADLWDKPPRAVASLKAPRVREHCPKCGNEMRSERVRRGMRTWICRACGERQKRSLSRSCG